MSSGSDALQNESGARQRSQWRINWLTPTVMIASLLAAVVAAVGNHALYAYVNGQVPVHQEVRAFGFSLLRCSSAVAEKTKTDADD